MQIRLTDASMTHYRRSKFPGGYYFFTVVTCRRRMILTSSQGRDCLRQAWMEVQVQKPFTTVALCLLPDHLHCIWKLPPEDADFSSRWAGIKSRFTHLWLDCGGTEMNQSLSRHKKRERGIWQRRFWEHQIRDWGDLAAHIKYIHYNPVKHGLVVHAANWEWSTYHKYENGGFYLSDILNIIQEDTVEIFAGE